MNENHLLKELSNSLSTRAKIDVQDPACVPLRAAEKSLSIQVAVKTQRALGLNRFAQVFMKYDKFS